MNEIASALSRRRHRGTRKNQGQEEFLQSTAFRGVRAFELNGHAVCTEGSEDAGFELQGRRTILEIQGDLDTGTGLEDEVRLDKHAVKTDIYAGSFQLLVIGL